MKLLFSLALFVLTSYAVNCSKISVEIAPDPAIKYANSITLEELKENLYEFASDAYEGRNTGEIGQKKAVHFLKSFYQNEGIKSNIESVWWR